MKSFVCVCLLLGLLSEPQAQTAEQAKAQARRTTEIAAVMSVLAQDSFGSIGYPKLFESCTQTTPPAELFDDRKDFGRAYFPLLQHVKKLQISTDSEADRWFAECLTRLMKASGPRGRYFSLEEVKRLNTGYLKAIGLIVTRLEGNWIVREAVPGSPAAEIGVKTGDVLLSVGGIELGGLTNLELSDALESVQEGETSLV